MAAGGPVSIWAIIYMLEGCISAERAYIMLTNKLAQIGALLFRVKDKEKLHKI